MSSSPGGQGNHLPGKPYQDVVTLLVWRRGYRLGGPYHSISTTPAQIVVLLRR